VVEETRVINGKKFDAKHGRTGFYSAHNNATVIVEDNKVITIIYNKR
jgi:hypothetical protein